MSIPLPLLGLLLTDVHLSIWLSPSPPSSDDCLPTGADLLAYHFLSSSSPDTFPVLPPGSGTSLPLPPESSSTPSSTSTSCPRLFPLPVTASRAFDRQPPPPPRASSITAALGRRLRLLHPQLPPPLPRPVPTDPDPRPLPARSPLMTSSHDGFTTSPPASSSRRCSHPSFLTQFIATIGSIDFVLGSIDC